MTVLVISPDYASHLLPLATVATAWRGAGARIVVATGPATSAIVDSFGFERVELQLGRGSNPGVIRAEQQPRGEDEALRGFFAATRLGMVETLQFQARARLNDLMWQPVAKARAVLDIVDLVQPSVVLVDHLAFSARLALTAAGVPHADVVLGHPTALPVRGEVYGFPPVWPAALAPDPAKLRDLRSLCELVSAAFTRQWNEALAELGSSTPASPDAFAEHGAVLLLNYPAELSDPARTALLPDPTFLGSAVRDDPPDPEVDAWLRASPEPFVYVSFGSFLSARSDVLAKVLRALRGLGLRAAIATGSTDPAELGDVPSGWLVREYLPQVTLLEAAAAAVTHGGNNSVTEAVTFGVPMLVLPFSTDQFAGAAGVERAGLGVVAAPNAVTVSELGAALAAVLNLPRSPRAALSESLRHHPGPRRAFEALAAATT